MAKRAAYTNVIDIRGDRGVFRMTEEERQQQIVACETKLNEWGIKDRHAFGAGIGFDSVMDAIEAKRVIDDVAIWQKVQNSNFRFYTADFPAVSLSTSNAMALTLKRARTPDINLNKIGKEARINKADDYARNMFDVIKKVQEEANVTSYRATIKELNDRGIETPNKKKNWQMGTLQNLYKRWAELGLIEPTPKPK